MLAVGAPALDARRYLVRQTTRESLAVVSEIAWRMDLETLEHVPAAGLALNDLGRIRLRLAQPLAADRYAENRSTGSFIVVDGTTHETVAAGMIG